MSHATPLAPPRTTAEQPIEGPQTDLGLVVHTVALLGLGALALATTWAYTWGALGYVAGGTLMTLGLTLAVVRQRGRAGDTIVRCPTCSDEFAVEGVMVGVAPMSCVHCGAFCRHRGSGAVVVPRDEIAAQPIFEVALPADEPRWDGSCSLCGSTPCLMQPVEGWARFRRHARTVMVPVCHLHLGSHVVEIAEAKAVRAEHGLALNFRSHRAAVRFRELNPAPGPSSRRPIP